MKRKTRCRTILVGGLPVLVRGDRPPSEKDINAIRELQFELMPLADALRKAQKAGKEVKRLRDGRLEVNGAGAMTTDEFIAWTKSI